MKKIALGALVLVVGLAIGWTLKKPATAPGNWATEQTTKNASFGAELSLVSGAVEYKQGQNEWKRAEQNTTLQEGDSVEVRGEGKAIISIDDGSAIRLNSNSSVTLSKLSGEIQIINNKGEVYTRVVKADRPFIVMANAVSYKSLGTAFETINTEDSQGVKVYESKVEILGTTEKSILVGTGEKYYLVNKEDKTIEKKLTKLEAKELTKEFVEWNKQKDLETVEFKDKMGVLIATEEKKETEEKKPVKTTASETETKESETEGKVSISAKASGSEITWTVNGYSKDGFKVVWSKQSGPTFPLRHPIDQYEYVSSPSGRSASITAFDGPGMYYARVCEYLSGVGCGQYSNQVQVNLE